MRSGNKEGMQRYMMLQGLTFISLFNESSYKEQRALMAKQNAASNTGIVEQARGDQKRRQQQVPTHSQHDNQPQRTHYLRAKR